MSCADMMSLLQMYLDGMTDEAETRQAERHLVECEACRGQLEGWRRVAAGVGALPPIPAPPGFADRVLAAVGREAAVPGVWQAHPHSPAGAEAAEAMRVSWTWAAAAALMIGVGLMLWLGPEGSAAASAARGLLGFLASLVGR